jgi:P4 family phage/plasmid primase-like protien
MATPLEIARQHIREGRAVIPVPYRAKNPGFDGWDRMRLTEQTAAQHFNGQPLNFGVVLGAPSHEEVDIDLDCSEAIEIAPRILPRTRTFGRASKPRSHAIYRATQKAGRTKQYRDPGRKMIVEYRANGGQTVYPPSVHETGEQIAWSDDTEIAHVDANTLQRCCAQIASAVLLVRAGLSVDAAVELVTAQTPDLRKHEAALGNGFARVSTWLGLNIASKESKQSARATSADRTTAVARARAYVAKMDPAISGQGGHSQTFYVAQVLARGFDLDDSDALTLLREYNARCKPAWLEHELQHKLKSANETGEMEIGSLLNADRVQSPKLSPPPHDPDTGEVLESRETVSRTSFALTDLGNAEHMVAERGRDLRYCHPWNKWLAFDGSRWRSDDSGAVHRTATATVRGMYADAAQLEDDNERKALVKHARACESRQRLESMISLSRSLPGVPVLPDELDRDPWILNCANGTIDLHTGTLRDHDRADLCTKIAPVAYSLTAQCPTWDRFLCEVLPDPEVRGFVQRFAGYSLTALVRERIVVFLYGQGANGKSVFLTTLRAALGDYAATMAGDLLIAKRGDAHPTEVADLCGVRLAVCSEVPVGRAFDEGLLKRLTGNEPVKARRMREDFFEFAPTWKLVLAANHRPTVRDTTDSIWDRIRQVPFTVRIPPEKQDRALGEKLSQELPGVLRWAVQGCLAWQRDGLGEPAAVATATADYRTEQDSIGRFLEECTVAEANAIEGATILFETFDAWRDSEGIRGISQQRFGKELRQRGFDQCERDKAGRKQWAGLRLSATGAALRSNRTMRGHFQVDRSSDSLSREIPESGSDRSEGFGNGGLDS